MQTFGLLIHSRLHGRGEKLVKGAVLRWSRVCEGTTGAWRLGLREGGKNTKSLIPAQTDMYLDRGADLKEGGGGFCNLDHPVACCGPFDFKNAADTKMQKLCTS